ncbi:MAG: helix-turn-helix domain-containing protein [Ruminococcus sp.]|nr:helix-turn-helix domain-containing protein [Ruminococcus sp.]
MFYERFLQICEQNKEKPTQVLKTIGVSSGNLSNWKTGGAVKSDILLQISKHFNVSVDYLLGRTDNPNSCNNIKNIDTTISGTQINGNQINATQGDSSLAEIETIISKLPKASKHRAIADMLDVLEKYT